MGVHVPLSEELVQYIESRVAPGTLLHALIDTNRRGADRTDASPPAEALQISVLELQGGASVSPHAHNRLPPHEGAERTQESWIVMRGSLQVTLFDVDNLPLRQQVLSSGWILITFRGGHSFECTSDGTLLVECKTGPYLGRDYSEF